LELLESFFSQIADRLYFLANWGGRSSWGQFFGGQNQAKPFLGFGGLFERRSGLILQNFLSIKGGPFSSFFPADSAIF